MHEPCFSYLLKNEEELLISYLASLIEEQTIIASHLCEILKKEEAVLAADIFGKAGTNTAAIYLANKYLPEAGAGQRIVLLEILAKAQYRKMEDRYKAAISTHKQLLKEYEVLYPEDTMGYAKKKYMLGCTYATAGKMKEANQIFSECAAIIMNDNGINASSIEALSAYCASCFALGNLQQAVSVLGKTIKLCIRSFGHSCQELARCYCYGWGILYAMGDKTKALQMVQKSYEICNELFFGHGPDYAWVAINAGTAFMVESKIDEAEDMYQKAIRENDAMIPKEERPHVYSLTTYSNLAVLHAYKGNKEKAKEISDFILKESFLKNGRNHVHTANLALVNGIIHSNTEKIEMAIEIYKKQEEYTPDYYFANVCLSRLYAKLNDEEKAANIIESVYNKYVPDGKETELLTFLFLETIDKVYGELLDDQMEEFEELFRYDDYRFYITHSNNSCVIEIPTI